MGQSIFYPGKYVFTNVLVDIPIACSGLYGSILTDTRITIYVFLRYSETN